MGKKVAVQDSLNEIKDELKRRGYNIISMEDGVEADAIVYMNEGNETPYIGDYDYNDELDSYNKGAILINANNKSIDEIDKIIKNRIYTPLF